MPEKEGWLQKESPSAFGFWQKRYFVLDKGTMTYSKKQGDGKPLGEIKVSEVTSVSVGGNNVIMLNAPHPKTSMPREFKLRAGDGNTAQGWVSAIQDGGGGVPGSVAGKAAPTPTSGAAAASSGAAAAPKKRASISGSNVVRVSGRRQADCPTLNASRQATSKQVVSAEHERLKSKLASEDALDIFRDYDSDKSGSIDYGEFVEALMAMELVKDAKDPVAKAMFDAFDPDGSGEVDYEEFQIYASNELRDPEGSHKVKKLGEELKANNTRFEDPEFPAGLAAIYEDPKKASRFGEVTWLRPEKIARPDQKVFAFEDGVSPEDIGQGALGDCYFLAAMANCAMREELIEDLIVEDYLEQGIYGVKLYVEGHWITVVVDDLTASIQVAGQWEPVFAKSKGEGGDGDDFETWVIVAEKAWAKYHGCYETIESGQTDDTLAYLTGGCSQTIHLHDHEIQKRQNEGKLWTDLLRIRSRENPEVHMNVFMTAEDAIIDADVKPNKKGGKASGSAKGDLDPSLLTAEERAEGGLVTGHAYSVLRMEEVEGNKIIQVRNPWGKYEWQGAWGDNDTVNWTESRKKAVNFVDADDGSFWMSFDDFFTHFGRVGVCTTLPPSYHQQTVQSKWVERVSAGGRRRAQYDKTEFDLWKYNPRFALRLSPEAKTVWIGIEQHDHRGKGESSHDFLQITTAIIANKGFHEEDDPDIKTDMIHEQRLFGRTGTQEIEVNPYEGPFIIIPATSRRGIEGTFWLRVACEYRFELLEVPTPTPSPAEAANMAAYVIPKFCLHCKKEFDEVKAKTFVVEDGKVHDTCHEAYKKASAPPCFICKKPITDGKVWEYDEGKVHDGKCNDEYNKQNAQICLVCKKPVGEEFFEYDDGVCCSEECADKYDEQ